LTLAGITAATKFDNFVTDTSGKITGVVGLVYTVSGTSTAAGLYGISVTATLANTNSFIWRAKLGTTDAQITVTGATAAAATTALTGGTPTTIAQAHGASSALTAVVKDQFGAVVPNSVVEVSTTGRNTSGTVVTTLATDANGRVSYTRTDAGTSATTNKQDVVTFNGAGVTNPTVTINYGSTAVGTIKVAFRSTSTGSAAFAGVITVVASCVNGVVSASKSYSRIVTAANAAGATLAGFTTNVELGLLLSSLEQLVKKLAEIAMIPKNFKIEFFILFVVFYSLLLQISNLIPLLKLTKHQS
jgi:hypothetical protein